MRLTKRTGSNAAALAAVAWMCGCGDASDRAPDASSSDASTIDAPVDSAWPAHCSYAELADVANASSANAELTGLDSSTAFVLCGRIHRGHFEVGTVDIDVFRFTVSSETDVLVQMTAAGAEALDGVALKLVDKSGGTVAFGRFEGTRATLAAHLIAGEYDTVVVASHANDLASDIDYEVRIATDAPLTRCPVLAGTVAIGLEQPTDNDVILWSESATPQASFTPSTLDAPQGSMSVFPGGNYRLAGSVDDVDVADDYMDRDTWGIKRGGTTNRVSLFVMSDATTVDFDLLVFKANTTVLVAASRRMTLTNDELVTFSTDPDATYWLWIGARDGATNLPQSYSVRPCGESIP